MQTQIYISNELYKNSAPAKSPQIDFSESGDYAESRDNIGAGDGNRTHDLLITNQLLCQLSYASIKKHSAEN